MKKNQPAKPSPPDVKSGVVLKTGERAAKTNVCVLHLTDHTKALLEDVASECGFKEVSAFILKVALEEAGRRRAENVPPLAFTA